MVGRSEWGLHPTDVSRGAVLQTPSTFFVHDTFEPRRAGPRSRRYLSLFVRAVNSCMCWRQTEQPTLACKCGLPFVVREAVQEAQAMPLEV